MTIGHRVETAWIDGYSQPSASLPYIETQVSP
jgi:hypothetical protein